MTGGAERLKIPFVETAARLECGFEQHQPRRIAGRHFVGDRLA
jgi:hypothetical protein